MHTKLTSSSVLLLGAINLVIGIAVPEALADTHQPLNRAFYNLKIRDVINHLYVAPLEKRDVDGNKIQAPSCRVGGTPEHKNGTLIGCGYSTSIEDYNRAIRSLHLKRKRSPLGDEGVKHLFPRKGSSSGGKGGGKGKGQAKGGGNVGGRQGKGISEGFKRPKSKGGAVGGDGGDDGDEESQYDLRAVFEDFVDDFEKENMQLWRDYTWHEDHCYDSGTWGPHDVLNSIRYDYCKRNYEMRMVSFVRHFSYFNRIGTDSRPEKGPLLINNEEIRIDTEYVPMRNEGADELDLICMRATYFIIFEQCQGWNPDTRGGGVTVQHVDPNDPNNEDKKSWYYYAIDPNDGVDYCC